MLDAVRSPKAEQQLRSKQFKIEDWLDYKAILSRDSFDLVGERFEFLEKKIMYLLRGERTPFVKQLLGKYFYPIWRYYINFYMNQMGIEEARRDDVFQTIYLSCSEMLDGIKWRGNDFNRIKRYYNKSIHGFVLNEAYKKDKKLVYSKTGESADSMLQSVPDIENNVYEFEVRNDLELVKAHIEEQFPIYFEYCATFRGDIYSMKNLFKERFRRYVLKEFKKSGRLMSGEDVFGRKYISVLT
jgi:uncharacterized protein YktA (UPF0223 family)